MLVDILRLVIWLVCLYLAISAFFFAIQLWLGHKSEYERNRRLSRSFHRVLRGEVPAYENGQRDYRVAAGIAIDEKTGELIDQGRLSEEALDAVLAPRRW